jgi:hypothetical protein
MSKKSFLKLIPQHLTPKKLTVTLITIVSLFSLSISVFAFSHTQDNQELKQVDAQTGERCFDETGQCINGPIRDYWEQNGGLPVFGYPITPQRVETVEGRTIPVQWFERDRLEIQANDTITAGRLGARLLELRGTPWESYSKVYSAPGGCRYFEPTKHSLCEPFLSYWNNNGGLERFGYPITEPMQETIGDWTGNVQYFERRRMEHHPENAGTDYEVQLGLLGKVVYNLDNLDDIRMESENPYEFKVSTSLCSNIKSYEFNVDYIDAQGNIFDSSSGSSDNITLENLSDPVIDLCVITVKNLDPSRIPNEIQVLITLHHQDNSLTYFKKIIELNQGVYT